MPTLQEVIDELVAKGMIAWRIADVVTWNNALKRLGVTMNSIVTDVSDCSLGEILEHQDHERERQI